MPDQPTAVDYAKLIADLLVQVSSQGSPQQTESPQPTATQKEQDLEYPGFWQEQAALRQRKSARESELGKQMPNIVSEMREQLASLQKAEAAQMQPPRYKPGGVWDRQSKESTALQEELRAIEESQPSGEWTTPKQIEYGMFGVPDAIRKAEDVAASRSDNPETARQALEAKRRLHAATPQTNLDLAAAMEPRPEPEQQQRTWYPQPSWSDIGAAGGGGPGGGGGGPGGPGGGGGGPGMFGGTGQGGGQGGGGAAPVVDTLQVWNMLLGMGQAGAKSYTGTATAMFADKGTKQALDDAMGLGVDALGDTAKGAAAGAAIGSVVPGIGTAAGAVAGALVGMSSSIAKLPAKILEWSEALIESRRDLAKWSGTLQRTFLEAQRRQYGREIESAANTQDTTAILSGTYQDILDTLRPMKDDVHNLTAFYVAKFVSGMDSVVQRILEINERMTLWRQILDSIEKNTRETGKPTNVKQWADAWRGIKLPSSRVPRR